MPVLEKAQLALLRDRGGQSRTRPEVEPGSEVDVQFNPASLRLRLTNAHERSDNPGRQVQQSIGINSENYTLELQFDSADEASPSGEPMSVRTKTETVERFLRPRRRGAQPPRLRFSWGDFTIDGVVESLDLEFDHFGFNGVPLRAKATLTIRRQDPERELLAEASRDAGATRSRASDSGGAAPGGAGGSTDRVAPAQGGESPAEFAARLGLDPAAWRGLDFEFEAGAGLSLSAGASVGFSAGMGIAAGLGVHVGFEAGASASVAAGFGLELDASVAAGATASFGAAANASLAAGFKLAAAGGVEAALELSAGIEVEAARAGSLAAFGAGARTSEGGSLAAYATSSTFSAAAAWGSSSSATGSARALPSGPSRAPQPRTPLARTGTRAGAQVEPARAPSPPRVDERARSFGLGVPLRERVELRSTRPNDRESAMPALLTHPTQAPWTGLAKEGQ